MKKATLKTVAVDFDGVLHQWDGDWKGYHVISGEPTKGSMDWLYSLVQNFEVNIFTTRALSWRGRRAVRKWLQKHGGTRYTAKMQLDGWGRGIKNVKITAKKYPCIVYLDDRAMRFDGRNWPTKNDIHKAKPWWRS